VQDSGSCGRMEQGVAFAGWVQAINTEQYWAGEDVVPIPECNTSNLGRHLMQSHVVQDAGVVQVFTAEQKHAQLVFTRHKTNLCGTIHII